MSIVKTLSQFEFMDELQHDEYAKWSYDAAEALYHYYDDLYMDEPYEFDRVAIRCDWSEYRSALEAYNEHHGVDDEGVGTSVGEDNTEENANTQALEYLQDNTQVIELDNGHVLIEEF